MAADKPQSLKAAIWTAHARITDKARMRKLLAPLPAKIAAEARKLAGPAFRGKAGTRYDAASKKAFFLQHEDDDVLFVWVFEAIESVEVAAGLGAAIEQAAPIDDIEHLHAIYTEVTGQLVETTGRHH